MIDVSDVVNDPDFATAFTIQRSAGSFVDGVWNPGTPTNVAMWGSIQPASDKEVSALPEGDQISAAIKVYSTQPIYTTAANPAGVSDIVVWNNEQYRVLKLLPWQGNGYYRAIAARMAGN
jgi:hypothetical protein